MKIQKTNTIAQRGISAIIYGESGIGKTTLAGTLEGKTLILSAESGLLSLANKEIDYISIEGNRPQEKLECIREVLDELKTKKVYDNIFIDSLSEINQIVISYQFEKVNNDLSKTLQVWGEVSKKMKGMIRAFRDLQNYNVVMTALVKVDKDEIGRRFVVPDLTGQLGGQVAQYYDEVFYYKILKTEEKEERVLYTQPTGNILAKDRSGKLKNIVEPNLGTIFKEIKQWK